jgi:hypothetical protein
MRMRRIFAGWEVGFHEAQPGNSAVNQKQVKLSISERAIALRPSSAVASALFKQQDNGQWHLDTEEYRGLQSRSFRRRKDKKDEGLCRPKMSGRANQVHKLVSTSD